MRVDLLVKVDNFDGLILRQYIQERLSKVARLIQKVPEIILAVENASFVILNFLCARLLGVSVNLLLEFVDLFDQQEGKLDMRELIEGLNEAHDVGIGVLGINLKQEQLFHISEFGLLFDELFENELVLLQADVHEIQSFQNLIDMLLRVAFQNVVDILCDRYVELLLRLIEPQDIVDQVWHNCVQNVEALLDSWDASLEDLLPLGLLDQIYHVEAELLKLLRMLAIL